MLCREHGTRSAGACAGDGTRAREDVAQRTTSPGTAPAGRAGTKGRGGIHGTEQPDRHVGKKYVSNFAQIVLVLKLTFIAKINYH